MLGIDPGTLRLGWGVVEAEGNRLTVLDFGVLKARANQPVGQRLHLLAKSLRRIAAEHRPDEAAVEEAFYGRDAKAAQRIGEARGAVHVVLADAAIPVTGYANNVVKKAVTGRGRATKAQVQAMVQRILSLDRPITSTDAADALALAICHHQRGALPGAENRLPERIAQAMAREDARRGRTRAKRPTTEPDGDRR